MEIFAPFRWKVILAWNIKQVPDERYEDFVARLKTAVERTIKSTEPAEIVLKQLAYEMPILPVRHCLDLLEVKEVFGLTYRPARTQELPLCRGCLSHSLEGRNCCPSYSGNEKKD